MRINFTTRLNTLKIPSDCIHVQFFVVFLPPISLSSGPKLLASQCYTFCTFPSSFSQLSSKTTVFVNLQLHQIVATYRLSLLFLPSFSQLCSETTFFTMLQLHQIEITLRTVRRGFARIRVSSVLLRNVNERRIFLRRAVYCVLLIFSSDFYDTCVLIMV